MHEVLEWMRIAIVCETTGQMPNPGGLFQQRSGHVHRLEAVYRAKGMYEKDMMDKNTRTTTEQHSRTEPERTVLI